MPLPAKYEKSSKAEFLLKTRENHQKVEKSLQKLEKTWKNMKKHENPIEDTIKPVKIRKKSRRNEQILETMK